MLETTLEHGFSNYKSNKQDFVWSAYKSFDIFTCSQIVHDWEKVTKLRGQRSPFDFGGEILHSLFGVSTVKNLDELKNDLDGKLEIHTIKVDQISRIVKLQQENLVEIRSLVEQLANFTQKEYNLHKIRGDVIRMCSAFNEIRINLELNHLNVDMINSLQIKKLVQKYSFQWNLNTLYNVDHPRFENTVVIKVVSTYEGKLALITIPFFPHETYLLYRLHKLPMFTNSSNTKKFILNSKFDFILSSSDQSKLALL